MLSSPPNSPRFAKIGVFDPKTGRYIRSPKKTVYGTKADARRALKEYRVELECGVKNPEELTVGNYVRAWYERRKNTGRYSPLTLKDDELQVRKIEDIWGATLLEDLTLKKISDAYDKLLASKKADMAATATAVAIAQAIVDRIVHNSYVIHIQGDESMRKRMSDIG